MNTSSEAKARASKLRDVLNLMRYQLKHTESLEVVSKLEGYPDWNTYTADLTRKQHVVELYPVDESTEIASTAPVWDRGRFAETTPVPDHPIIDAIKSNNEILLRESLSSEVHRNNLIMSEAFYQSVVLERVSLAKVMIKQGADLASVVIRRMTLFEYVIHTEREDYLKMLVFQFKHLKGIHRNSSRILPLVVSIPNKDDNALEPKKNLLDQGANINIKDNGGISALDKARLRGHSEAIRMLVERKKLK